MVSGLLCVLSRRAIQLSHLVWRATAVDHVVIARCVGHPNALTYRQSGLLGVVVRVLPHWELAAGT